MSEFPDVLSFRRTVSPYLLQVLFWAGIGGVLYGSWILFERDHWAWWISLVFGSLVTQVLFERAILAFQTYERMNEIAAKLTKDQAGIE